jgi:hypothetical protein
MRPHTALLLLALSLAACAAQPSPANGHHAATGAASKAAPPATDAATTDEDVAPSGRGGGIAGEAAGGNNAVIPVVPLGQAFQLPYDHLVRVGDTGVRLRFDAVLEDSRCPRGVACVWAGRARVHVALMPREGDAESVELGTEGGQESATAAGLVLELRGIEPPRTAGQAERTPPERYALTLVARRAG